MSTLRYFILRGCRPTRAMNGGFFVENLKSLYHPIRSTLEAHAQAVPIAGVDSASACGIAFQKNNKAREDAFQLRVTAGGVRSVYKIDRWD